MVFNYIYFPPFFFQLRIGQRLCSRRTFWALRSATRHSPFATRNSQLAILFAIKDIFRWLLFAFCAFCWNGQTIGIMVQKNKQELQPKAQKCKSQMPKVQAKHAQSRKNSYIYCINCKKQIKQSMHKTNSFNRSKNKKKITIKQKSYMNIFNLKLAWNTAG